MVPQRPAFAVSLSPPTLQSGGGFDEALRRPSVPQPSPHLSPWGHQGNSEDVGDILSNWPGCDFLGRSLTPTSAGQYTWSTDQQSNFVSIMGCVEGCTAHSDEVHDAIRTLHAYRTGQNQWTGSSWAPYSAWTLVPSMPPDPSGFPWPLANPGQEILQVPVAQAMQTSELLSICESSQLRPPSPPAFES